MTLSEFRLLEASKLRAFTAWYRLQQRDDPRLPSVMPDEEWTERIRQWCLQNTFDEDLEPL
jgi:hypothetical protein